MHCDVFVTDQVKLCTKAPEKAVLSIQAMGGHILAQGINVPGYRWFCGTRCNEKTMPGDRRQERFGGGKKATREMRMTIKQNYSLFGELSVSRCIK
jgi:hypothetical protein